jgi:hypothetical protein
MCARVCARGPACARVCPWGPTESLEGQPEAGFKEARPPRATPPRLCGGWLAGMPPRAAARVTYGCLWGPTGACGCPRGPTKPRSSGIAGVLTHVSPRVPACAHGGPRGPTCGHGGPQRALRGNRRPGFKRQDHPAPPPVLRWLVGRYAPCEADRVAYGCLRGPTGACGCPRGPTGACGCPRGPTKPRNSGIMGVLAHSADHM